jgi:hypothetical protein
MPYYKYVTNRALTFLENILLDYKLSEYHTGYRAFSRQILEKLPLHLNSDDFVFDAEMLAQIIYAGFSIGEISCPTRYMDDSSSIDFKSSVIYGIGVLQVSMAFRLTRWKMISDPRFTSVS